MTMVDINDGIYEEVKKFIKNKGIDFPSINYFINQAVKEKLKKK